MGSQVPAFSVICFVGPGSSTIESILGLLDRGFAIPGVDTPTRFKVLASQIATWMSPGLILIITAPVATDSDHAAQLVEQATVVRHQLETETAELFEDHLGLRSTTSALCEVLHVEPSDDSRSEFVAQQSGLRSRSSRTLSVDFFRSGGEASIFRDSLLREVRFGLSRTASASQFGDILTAFASALGDRSIPIAYVMSPAEWTPSTGASSLGDSGDAERLWIRVGYAVPSRSLIAVADSLAVVAANDAGAQLWFWDPSNEGASFEAKFRERATDPTPLAVAPWSETIDSGTRGDFATVMVEAPAQAGLIGEILQSGLNSSPDLIWSIDSDVIRNVSKHVPSHFRQHVALDHDKVVLQIPMSGGLSKAVRPITLRDCSMAVLYGRTYLAMSIERSRVTDFVSNISPFLSTWEATVFVAEPPRGSEHPAVVSALSADSITRHAPPLDKSFWVAWRSVESPGIMLHVLEDLHAALPTSTGADPLNSQFSVSYGITRVLDDERFIASGGAACAGKLQLACTTDLHRRLMQPHHTDALVGALERRLQQHVTAGRQASPERSAEEWRTWVGPAFAIGVREPNKDPWAHLVALDFDVKPTT